MALFVNALLKPSGTVNVQPIKKFQAVFSLEYFSGGVEVRGSKRMWLIYGQ